MKTPSIDAGALRLAFRSRRSGPELSSSLNDSLRIGPLRPEITVDGKELLTASTASRVTKPTQAVLRTQYVEPGLTLLQRFAVKNGGIVMDSQIRNLSDESISLNAVRLLSLDTSYEGRASFSEDPSTVRVFEQGNYWCRVRWLGSSESEQPTGAEGGAVSPSKHRSDLCWVGYDASSRAALLAGFLTEERWLGRIGTQEIPGQQPVSWWVGFDGGDVMIEPGEDTRLEDVLLMAGQDPWDLLMSYADVVRKRHRVRLPPTSPVSWCSWYPHRLGVTEDRVLANAEMAARRLKDLGMTIIQVDLGWEKGHLPSSFEENDQFPHGLAWLSARLQRLGFILGVWKAPFTVSEHDSVFRDHPDWLLGGEGQRPLARGEWFWEPHGKVYGLDLTHPQAREWLRDSIRSLGERGVGYLKADFIGIAGDSALRQRDDPRMVAGGGTEAARTGLEIIRDQLRAYHPDALLLNCSGPELPGKGAFPLIYACNDSGNTGYVGWDHHMKNYGYNLAGHLFKHRKWGVIQPSCLCVGLPGTIEESRLRATATFLSGGQVDVGDDLTLLPEDRWRILLSTLPPTGLAARPVDLFEPVEISCCAYEAMCRGEIKSEAPRSSLPGSRVWRLHLSSDWDSWHLVALFSYEAPLDRDGRPTITGFTIPLHRLGLGTGQGLWAYEFWSGQFLGDIPAKQQNREGYVHPGDAQAMVLEDDEHALKVNFFGPAVKLLALRKKRVHPWVVGTSFHQSCGLELSGVAWNGTTLRGQIRRPAGQEGFLAIAGAPHSPGTALVNGQPTGVREGANRSLLVPIVTRSNLTPWELSWT